MIFHESLRKKLSYVNYLYEGFDRMLRCCSWDKIHCLVWSLLYGLLISDRNQRSCFTQIHLEVFNIILRLKVWDERFTFSWSYNSRSKVKCVRFTRDEIFYLIVIIFYLHYRSRGDETLQFWTIKVALWLSLDTLRSANWNQLASKSLKWKK